MLYKISKKPWQEKISHLTGIISSKWVINSIDFLKLSEILDTRELEDIFCSSIRNMKDNTRAL